MNVILLLFYLQHNDLIMISNWYDNYLIYLITMDISRLLHTFYKLPVISNWFRMQTMEGNIRMIGRNAKTSMIVRESRIFREMNSIKAAKNSREFKNGQ